MKYSELITLGVTTFGNALNVKCNNAKCNKLIVQIKKFLKFLLGFREAEMERNNTINYLKSKIVYHIHYLIENMEYSELITLGTITVGVALNAKCNNAKCNKLIVSSQKCL